MCLTPFFSAGRGLKSHAYIHSVQFSHHVFLNLHTLKFYCLPDNYEIIDSSLEDITVGGISGAEMGRGLGLVGGAWVDSQPVYCSGLWLCDDVLCWTLVQRRKKAASLDCLWRCWAAASHLNFRCCFCCIVMCHSGLEPNVLATESTWSLISDLTCSNKFHVKKSHGSCACA